MAESSIAPLGTIKNMFFFSGLRSFGRSFVRIIKIAASRKLEDSIMMFSMLRKGIPMTKDFDNMGEKIWTPPLVM